MTDGSIQDRGRDYARPDWSRTRPPRRRGGRVRATVHGTYDHTVTLDAERGECDCPYAMESTICKAHCSGGGPRSAGSRP